MQVATGPVVDGASLAVGSVQAVFCCERDAPSVLSADDEEELLVAMAEIARGEFTSPEELFESLRQHG